MITEPGIYIGIGMVLSLFLTETLGVTAGGIIVPGYIAMNLESPERLIITFGISIITFLIIKSLSQFIMVYGKRRLVLALLIGFLLGYLTRSENNLVSSLTELDFATSDPTSYASFSNSGVQPLSLLPITKIWRFFILDSTI